MNEDVIANLPPGINLTPELLESLAGKKRRPAPLAAQPPTYMPGDLIPVPISGMGFRIGPHELMLMHSLLRTAAPFTPPVRQVPVGKYNMTLTPDELRDLQDIGDAPI